MILDFVNMGLGSVLLLLMLLIFSALRILREYERGVVFQLGRFWKVKGPGLVLVIPGIQQMVRVDLRVVTLDVPPQDVISRDNVSVKVNAVLYFRIVDPERAIIKVEDFISNVGANVILNGCVNGTNPDFCSLVHRDVNGTIRSTQGFVYWSSLSSCPVLSRWRQW